jgi:hypothetical protein
MHFFLSDKVEIWQLDLFLVLLNSLSWFLTLLFSVFSRKYKGRTQGQIGKVQRESSCTYCLLP